MSSLGRGKRASATDGLGLHVTRGIGRRASWSYAVLIAIGRMVSRRLDFLEDAATMFVGLMVLWPLIGAYFILTLGGHENEEEK
jgi:hypothetical protein